MSKETNELRKLSDGELLDRRRELMFKFTGSHDGVKPLVPPMKRGLIRIGIARIDTILGERKRRGFTKDVKKATNNN